MDNTPKFNCLKSFVGKILKSLMIKINIESNYCILRRHKLFGQAPKKRLRDFEHQKP